MTNQRALRIVALVLALVFAVSASAQTYTKTIRTDERLRFDVEPKTADVPPQPAQLDGPPVVTSSDTSCATATRYDPSIATAYWITAVGQPCSATVTIAATSGGADRTETIAVTVVVVQAANLGLKFTGPVKK